MYEEAEKLFLSSKAYDKLSQFYQVFILIIIRYDIKLLLDNILNQSYIFKYLTLQARGEWKKAIDIVTNYNKINIKPTYYNYGKYLEEMGDYNEAIKAYEKSGNSK